MSPTHAATFSCFPGPDFTALCPFTTLGGRNHGVLFLWHRRALEVNEGRGRWETCSVMCRVHTLRSCAGLACSLAPSQRPPNCPSPGDAHSWEISVPLLCPPPTPPHHPGTGNCSTGSTPSAKYRCVSLSHTLGAHSCKTHKPTYTSKETGVYSCNWAHVHPCTYVQTPDTPVHPHMHVPRLCPTVRRPRQVGITLIVTADTRLMIHKSGH